jgi:uncharacterized protein YcbK (DUF882 family)
MTRNEWQEVCDAKLCALGIQNFSALEICDVGRKANKVSLTAPTLDLLANAIQLIDVLQWVRNHGVSAPVLINSWYRDPDYNSEIGGVMNSMHLTCGAADIVKVGYTPDQVADMLEWHPFSDKLGIGKYNTFTHIDIRGMLGRSAPARW